MVAPFEIALRHAAADLDALGLKWALIGGVAISVRSEPRFTKDVDFVVAVADDQAAESVVHQLSSRGYSPLEVLEQEYVDRLSGVRLGSSTTPVVIDLLFASSGIEDEIVAAATEVDVLPGLRVPVASTGHLMALKVLAGRPRPHRPGRPHHDSHRR